MADVRMINYSTDSNGVALDPHPWQVSNEAGTNVLLQSQSVNTAPWLIDSDTVVTGVWCQPLGKSNAVTISETTLALKNTYQTPFTILPQSVVRILIKSGSLEWLRVTTFGFDTNNFNYINVQTKTLGATDSEVEIVELTDGWFYIYLDLKSTTVLDGGLYILGVIGDSISAAPPANSTYTLSSAEILTGVTIEQAKLLPPVPTTTAAASIPATPYTYPAANIDPANAHIKMTFDAGLVDKTLIDIGGMPLLSYTAGDLVLSDGTNSSTVSLSAGTHKLEIILTPTTMQLIVDDVAETAVTYSPITAGLITNTTPKFYQFTSKAL